LNDPYDVLNFSVRCLHESWISFWRPIST